MKNIQVKHGFRRILALLLALCCMTTVALADTASPLPFTDVQKGSYYYDAVDWAYQNDITKGTSATEFSPNMGCSRGQVVTFLWRTAGSPKESRITPFNDVKSDDYYRDAVAWAVWNNITAGTSATMPSPLQNIIAGTSATFSPLQNCTYEQILTFIHRAVKEPGAKPGVKTIADNYSDSEWYKAAIRWADSYGLLKNTSGFKLGKVCPRCDIVEYLYAYSQIDEIMDDPDKVGTVDVRVNDTLYADQAKKEGNDFYVSTDFVKSALGVNMTSNRADKLVKATDAAKAAGAMYEYSDVYDVVHFLKSTAFTASQAETLRAMEMTSSDSFLVKFNPNYAIFGYGLTEDYKKDPSDVQYPNELPYGKKEDRLPALTSKANSYELMVKYGTSGKRAVDIAKAAVCVDCEDYKMEFITDETMTWQGDSTKSIVVVRGYYKLTPYKSDWMQMSNANRTRLTSMQAGWMSQSKVSYMPVDLFISGTGSLMHVNRLGQATLSL